MNARDRSPVANGRSTRMLHDRGARADFGAAAPRDTWPLMSPARRGGRGAGSRADQPSAAASDAAPDSLDRSVAPATRTRDAGIRAVKVLPAPGALSIARSA